MPLKKFIESDYSFEYFRDFIIAIFGKNIGVKVPTEQLLQENYLQSYIKVCDFITLDNAQKLGVFVFKTKSIKSKIALHQELKRFMGYQNEALSAILAVFYLDDKEQNSRKVRNLAHSSEFRLSLITTNFDFTTNKISYSNLKRQSFVLGRDVPSHTAFAAFSALLAKPKTLENIEEAFSVEPVTKEFFDRYKACFELVCEKLNPANAEFSNIATTNLGDKTAAQKAKEAFAKKLLGRLVFLYFLQKKGWLGVPKGENYGLGDKNFLSNLFKNHKNLCENSGVNLRENSSVNSHENSSINSSVNSSQCHSERSGSVAKNPTACHVELSQESETSLFQSPKKSPENRDFSFATQTQNDKILANSHENSTENLSVNSNENSAVNSHANSSVNSSTNSPANSTTNSRTNSTENFYQSCLCPLFFESLNTKRDGDFSEIFDCKIPFLNGGLFEENYVEFTDFSGKYKKSIDRDFIVAQCLDDGIFAQIFELFDGFNFTIEESTPSEIEISIDPEMLGKVFENLIDYNKQSGAFYTPREIVSFMCQNALLQALLTHFPDDENDLRVLIFDHQSDTKFAKIHGAALKNTLLNLKILDPSIGSGAFPMGLLQELMQILESLDKTMSAAQKAEFKRQIVQNQIYGLDIDADAIDIARLRFWLSIAVDEVCEDGTSPKPLPNLDFKFMQGNSLVECLNGIEILPKNLENYKDERNLFGRDAKSSLFDKDALQVLSELFLCYFTQTNSTQKHALKNEILGRIKSIFDERIATYDDFAQSLENHLALNPNQSTKERAKKEGQILSYSKFISDLNELFNDYKERNFHSSKLFLYRLFFADVFKSGGFDIVIGNPPYIGEKGHKDIFEAVRRGGLGEFYLGKMDYFYFFFHLGLNLLKNGGILAFITTNYFITAKGGKKLREDFKARANILTLVNFGENKVFSSAQGQHNIISILSKSQPQGTVQIYSLAKGANIHKNSIKELLNSEFTTHFSKAQLYEGSESEMRITAPVNAEFEGIFSKMTKDSEMLGEICAVNTGIQSGADKVTQRHLSDYGWDFQKDDGIFVVSDSEAKSKKLEKAFLKPFFKNSDIAKFSTNLNSKAKIIYLTGKEDENEMPNILAHLRNFKLKFDDLHKEHGDIGKWWALWRPRKQEIFEVPKIVAPQRSHTNTFGYNENAWYATSDVFFITAKDDKFELKYILALLNSRLFYFWLYHKGKRKGDTLELIAKPISQIPIKQAPKEIKAKLIVLVNEILDLKSCVNSNKCHSERSGSVAKNPTAENLANLSVNLVENSSETAATPSLRGDKVAEAARTKWFRVAKRVTSATARSKIHEPEISKSLIASTFAKSRNDSESEIPSVNPSEISRLEREINALVYKLYDLTPSEIALIEN